MTTNNYNMKNISTFYAKSVDLTNFNIYNKSTKTNMKQNSHSHKERIYAGINSTVKRSNEGYKSCCR